MKYSIILLALLLSGCSDYESMSYLPVTPEEQKCVQETQIKIISSTPKSLAGHDQDWDDAIKAANDVANKSCCKPRMWLKDFNGFHKGSYREIR